MVLEKGIPYVECLRFVGDEVPNEVIHRAAGLQISGLFGVALVSVKIPRHRILGEYTISLCHVSRLVRPTVLPEFLHTVLLPKRRNLEAFTFALESQKEYAEKKSHLAFDYIPAVQRMWISRTTEDLLWDGDKLNLHMTTLLPVLLAVPTLAVECCYLPLIVISSRLSLVDESLDDSQSLHTDPNGHHRTSPVLIDESLEGSQSLHSDPNVGHRPSPVLEKTLIVTVKSDQFNFQNYFKYIPEESVFFASITHLTYLIELNRDLDTFRAISKGSKSPDFPLGSWMSDIPWDRMNNLETFSVVYPHLGLPQKTNLSFDQGVDLHVERLIVSVTLDASRGLQRRLL
ncbi:hypothetical protein P692DRAFT_201862747 [Suillus brevipes Sb2]|nr:hypothetical protein P692DRAFT_201862747 [Suillus brevipes Sb2]